MVGVANAAISAAETARAAIQGRRPLNDEVVVGVARCGRLECALECEARLADIAQALTRILDEARRDQRTHAG
jgi:hypothetical protein